MLAALAGWRSYLIGGLALAVLALGSATYYFRSSYQYEALAHRQTKTALEQTVASLEKARGEISAFNDTVKRVQEDNKRLRTIRDTNKTRFQNEEDGTVAPVLRCAVTGVCRD